MKIYSSLKEIAYQVLMTPRMMSAPWSYDDYWRAKRGNSMGEANDYQRARAAWIADRVSAGQSVLDLGCGDGAVLLALRERVAIDALGADISDLALEFLQQKGVTVHRCDLSDIASVEALPEVDHVLLLEVLEHMPRPEEFLLRVRRKARHSVIFSFPNTGYISYRLRLLFGRFPVQWRVSPGEHLRFWTYQDLKWWLSELGLLKFSIFTGYAGVPGLARWWPGLFSAALIAQVRASKAQGDTTL